MQKGKKRPSLADIINEEAAAGNLQKEQIANPISDFGKVPADRSDFIKASVTLPPDMFWAMDDLSRARRRMGRSDYTVCDILREALADLLQKEAGK